MESTYSSFITSNMKKCFLSLTAILLILAILQGCKKDDPIPYPLSELPAATQTGENTFGCLIDGKVFKPKRKFGSTSIILQCNYQYFNDQHHFILAAHDKINVNSVGIGMTDVILDKKVTIPFTSSTKIKGNCGESLAPGVGYKYATYENSPGEFRIEHFDSIKQIISGTFWFDAIDTATGETVQVRDGRFDVEFTY